MREEVDRSLVIVTGIIWITFGALVDTIHDDPFPGNFLMVAAVSFLVIVVTAIMWRVGGTGLGEERHRYASSYEKSKRTENGLESALLLLQMLDDNERAMLKQRLLNNLGPEDGDVKNPGIYETPDDRSSASRQRDW